MKRLWHRSLAAQFIVFLLTALVLSQGIGLLISWDERGQALRAAAKSEFFSRTVSLARLIQTTPATIHGGILDASATNYTRFWVSTEEPHDANMWRHEAWAQLAKPLPNLIKPHQKPPGVEPGQIVAEAPAGLTTSAMAAPQSWVTLPPAKWPLQQPAKFVSLDDAYGMGLSVNLENGTWLNAAFAKSVPNSIWTSQSAVSLAITAVVLSLIAMLVARGIARPMRRLAVAAEALGRGETVTPLPESGPDDIRQTAEAFNRMQARLQRFVADRTRMLAAIGHDLRTPLTSLRLRTEFVTDLEIQDKMLKTISEIETMTEAALAFAREEATAETTRTVDLGALVESLCDDLAELGRDVTFVEGPTVTYRCRPDGLRRAVRNLVENAVRYGERARVSLRGTVESIDIVVDDDGPGIPEAAMGRVFAPFYRLEQSRNRETGGIGLGLSIARTIARHHGGDVSLVNQARGLRATINLPRLGQAVLLTR